ncbi:MAG: 50S ribosomal protein L6 [Candidatus Palauibacterales bacterium]|nr:50S ribosomal protein L6 [Candidatus Palauibacterales bacterium]MDP2482516.1 50S ribosomal protein L6 [Candidatus Palauibacterales bacterium]
MSRVGRQPIVIPDGVNVTIEGSRVTVKGARGELSGRFDADMGLEMKDGAIHVSRPTDQPRHRALHGLTRSLLANMVHGVHEGFERSLEIHGVGYRAQQKGSAVELAVGYSNPVLFEAPEGISLVVETPTLVHVRGIDKQVVGEVASRIRRIRPPEPYKGKGIRYRGEHVRRKAGKATAVGA